MSTYLWAIVLLVSLGIELLTPSALVSLWFALGALVSMILSFFLSDALIIETLVFAAVSLISLLSLRPLVTHAMRGEIIATGADRLIGKRFRLIKAISKESLGEIRNSGILWRVKAGEEELPEGSLVEVLSIDGTTLNVRLVKEN